MFFARENVLPVSTNNSEMQDSKRIFPNPLLLFLYHDAHVHSSKAAQFGK